MKVAVLAATLAAMLAATPVAAQKKIQCWTDKNGVRMCGDRVPPEYSGEKRDVMKQGRVVDTIDASKTADEREAEKRRKAEELAKQKQAEYDRALLEMYRSQDDITTTRDERISLIDSRVQALEKNASDTDKGLAGLRARAEAAAAKNEPVDADLAKRIRQFEKAQAENTKALERNRKEREAMQAKYERDFMRYAELRGLPQKQMPPPKSAAAPAEPAKPADPKAGTAATPATPAQPAKKGG